MRGKNQCNFKYPHMFNLTSTDYYKMLCFKNKRLITRSQLAYLLRQETACVKTFKVILKRDRNSKKK